MTLCASMFMHFIKSVSSVFRYLFLQSSPPPVVGLGTQKRSVEDKKNGKKNRSASYRYALAAMVMYYYNKYFINKGYNGQFLLKLALRDDSAV